MDSAKNKSVARSFFRQMIFTFCLHAPIPLKIGKRHHGKFSWVCSRCRQRDWRCRWYQKIGSFFLWIYCKSVISYLSQDLFLISGLASSMGGFRHSGDVVLSSGDWTHLQQSHAWRQDFTHFNGYLDRCAWITPGPIQVKNTEEDTFSSSTWKALQKCSFQTEWIPQSLLLSSFTEDSMMHRD